MEWLVRKLCVIAMVGVLACSLIGCGETVTPTDPAETKKTEDELKSTMMEQYKGGNKAPAKPETK